MSRAKCLRCKGEGQTYIYDRFTMCRYCNGLGYIILPAQEQDLQPVYDSLSQETQRHVDGLAANVVDNAARRRARQFGTGASRQLVLAVLKWLLEHGHL